MWSRVRFSHPAPASAGASRNGAHSLVVGGADLGADRCSRSVHRPLGRAGDPARVTQLGRADPFPVDVVHALGGERSNASRTILEVFRISGFASVVTIE
jgi:hypothetical protein